MLGYLLFLKQQVVYEPKEKGDRHSDTLKLEFLKIEFSNFQIVIISGYASNHICVTDIMSSSAEYSATNENEHKILIFIC